MKTLIIFLCVALVSAAFVAAEEPDCPANKEFGSFGDCPESCLSLQGKAPLACTLKLNYGCKCKEGFVLSKDRDFSSDCVKPEDCQ